jgi:hypothetical protein
VRAGNVRPPTDRLVSRKTSRTHPVCVQRCAARAASIRPVRKASAQSS